MKTDVLKKLIKEAVKEAIQDELKDILLEAVEGDIELKTMVGDILFNSGKDLKEEIGGNQETNVTGTITIKASTVDFSNS